MALLLLLGCRREAAVKKLTEADGKPRRVTCTLPSEEPITVDVTVPARCDPSIEKPGCQVISGRLMHGGTGAPGSRGVADS